MPISEAQAEWDEEREEGRKHTADVRQRERLAAAREKSFRLRGLRQKSTSHKTPEERVRLARRARLAPRDRPPTEVQDPSGRRIVPTAFLSKRPRLPWKRGRRARPAAVPAPVVVDRAMAIRFTARFKRDGTLPTATREAVLAAVGDGPMPDQLGKAYKRMVQMLLVRSNSDLQNPGPCQLLAKNGSWLTGKQVRLEQLKKKGVWTCRCCGGRMEMRGDRFYHPSDVDAFEDLKVVQPPPESPAPAAQAAVATPTASEAAPAPPAPVAAPPPLQPPTPSEAVVAAPPPGPPPVHVVVTKKAPPPAPVDEGDWADDAFLQLAEAARAARAPVEEPAAAPPVPAASAPAAALSPVAPGPALALSPPVVTPQEQAEYDQAARKATASVLGLTPQQYDALREAQGFSGTSPAPPPTAVSPKEAARQTRYERRMRQVTAVPPPGSHVVTVPPGFVEVTKVLPKAQPAVLGEAPYVRGARVQRGFGPGPGSLPPLSRTPVLGVPAPGPRRPSVSDLPSPPTHPPGAPPAPPPAPAPAPGPGPAQPHPPVAPAPPPLPPACLRGLNPRDLVFEVPHVSIVIVWVMWIFDLCMGRPARRLQIATNAPFIVELARTFGHVLTLQEASCATLIDDAVEQEYTGERRLVADRGVKEEKAPLECHRLRLMMPTPRPRHVYLFLYVVVFLLSAALPLASAFTELAEHNWLCTFLAVAINVATWFARVALWPHMYTREMGEFSVFYLPHSLSCVLAEFSLGTNAEAVSSNLRARLRRLGSLPVRDADAYQYLAGTERVARAVLASGDFTGAEVGGFGPPRWQFT